VRIRYQGTGRRTIPSARLTVSSGEAFVVDDELGEALLTQPAFVAAPAGDGAEETTVPPGWTGPLPEVDAGDDAELLEPLDDDDLEPLDDDDLELDDDDALEGDDREPTDQHAGDSRQEG
jgi:hypothetical protein